MDNCCAGMCVHVRDVNKGLEEARSIINIFIIHVDDIMFLAICDPHICFGGE